MYVLLCLGRKGKLFVLYSVVYTIKQLNSISYLCVALLRMFIFGAKGFINGSLTKIEDDGKFQNSEHV